MLKAYPKILRDTHNSVGQTIAYCQHMSNTLMHYYMLRIYNYKLRSLYQIEKIHWHIHILEVQPYSMHKLDSSSHKYHR